MAKYVLKDATLELDGHDVSSRVRGLSVTMTADDVDSSTMGDGVHQHIGGLRSDNYEVTFANDPTVLDPVLYPLLATASTTPEFTADASAFAGAASVNNPHYTTGAAILLAYNPISGEIGALSEFQVTIPSNEAIVRTYT